MELKKFKMVNCVWHVSTFAFYNLLTTLFLNGVPCISSADDDSFSEELSIRRLGSGDIHSLFHFRTVIAANNEDKFSHFNLFPKSLGQIIKKYSIQELHLTLTHGFWRTQNWGYPSTVAPPGAELWVWFSSALDENSINDKWTGLVNALSGQFCASLNFITESNSASPRLSFKPLGLWPEDEQNSTKFLKYSTLPRENVCTENLTPWKKLLPCEGKAGLSTLLNALVLYNTAYHSIGVHLRSICKDEECLEPSVELKQTLSLVHDSITSDVRQDWLLSRLYGRSLESRCPLASHSRILVHTIDKSKKTTISPAPTGYENMVVDQHTFTYAVYDLKQIDFRRPLNIAVQHKAPLPTGKINKPWISAERYLVGYGGEYGGIVCSIYNNHPVKDIKIIYFDSLPWFIRVYLSSLSVTVDGATVPRELLMYIPSKDRKRPTTLEMMLTIPAQKTLTVSVDYEKAFLKWTEHPPDSHHGFYVGSSVVSVVLPDPRNTSGFSERCGLLSSTTSCHDEDHLFVRIYTKPLLVVLPTPDFSMPFNVICLSCTVVAIAFGVLFNTATKTIVVASKTEKSSIKEYLKGIFKRLCKRGAVKTKTE